jgi:hypothetical protein
MGTTASPAPGFGTTKMVKPKIVVLKICRSANHQRLYFWLTPEGEENRILGERVISVAAVNELAIEWSTSSRNFAEKYHRNIRSSDPYTKSDLVQDIAKFIAAYSERILRELLPPFDDKFFWDSFQSWVDQQSREAFADPTSPNWVRLPLLQVRTEAALLGIPWWLARTRDHKSLWCCRYALAMAPDQIELRPPNLLYHDLKILSLTRPTRDLSRWAPFEAATDLLPNTAAPEWPSTTTPEFKPSWTMLDGVWGHQQFDTIDDLLDFIHRQPARSDFKGIPLHTLTSILDDLAESAKPSLFLYQGHCTMDEGGAPLLSLTSSRPSAKLIKDQSEENDPVPLLTAFPPPHCRDSIVILEACESAGPTNTGQHIEGYLKEKAIFIGLTYPLLADEARIQINAFLKELFNNPHVHLAQLVLRANRLDQPFKNWPLSAEDACDLYRKASLCIFGSVNTNLSFQNLEKQTSEPLPAAELMAQQHAKGRGLSATGAENRSPLPLDIAIRW